MTAVLTAFDLPVHRLLLSAAALSRRIPHLFFSQVRLRDRHVDPTMVQKKEEEDGAAKRGHPFFNHFVIYFASYSTKVIVKNRLVRRLCQINQEPSCIKTYY